MDPRVGARGPVSRVRGATRQDGHHHGVFARQPAGAAYRTDPRLPCAFLSVRPRNGSAPGKPLTAIAAVR